MDVQLLSVRIQSAEYSIVRLWCDGLIGVLKSRKLRLCLSGKGALIAPAAERLAGAELC